MLSHRCQTAQRKNVPAFFSFENCLKHSVLLLFEALGIYFIVLVNGQSIPYLFIILILFYLAITDYWNNPTNTITILGVILILILIIGETSVTKGKLMYRDGAYELATETKFFISPFAHEKPLEIAPPLKGKLIITNEPMDWSVSAKYKLEPETRLMVEDLASMRLLVKEGVEIPRRLYSDENNPRIALADFLNDKYPFLRFEEIVVRKFTAQVWK